METLTSELLAGLPALCAVLLGPLFSLHVVRREFAAQVLSGNRQEWINSLRDRIARLIGFIAHYSAAKATGQLDEQTALARHETAYGLWAEISLMMNPAESDHAELLRSIDSTLQFLFASPAAIDPVRVRQMMDGLTSQSQRILKREWERVKKGE